MKIGVFILMCFGIMGCSSSAIKLYRSYDTRKNIKTNRKIVSEEILLNNECKFVFNAFSYKEIFHGPFLLPIIPSNLFSYNYPDGKYLYYNIYIKTNNKNLKLDIGTISKNAETNKPIEPVIFDRSSYLIINKKDTVLMKLYNMDYSDYGHFFHYNIFTQKELNGVKVKSIQIRTGNKLIDDAIEDIIFIRNTELEYIPLKTHC